MNCLIENEYIKELSLQKIKSPMYSQMNCLIENEYIRELSLPKKITYVFPNELPNWKRLHKRNFPSKKKKLCINELPNWKRILKGKNGKKREKKIGVLYCGGVLLLWTGSWRTLLRGGLLTPCEHYIILSSGVQTYFGGLWEGTLRSVWQFFTFEFLKDSKDTEWQGEFSLQSCNGM